MQIKIISGGQTGVDRAALDAAIEAGWPYGGYVPKGRLAEDGIIPEYYALTECEFEDYAFRTKLNVQAADATLIIHRFELTGGTRLTYDHCKRYRKPVETIGLDQLTFDEAHERAVGFLKRYRAKTLNVAGPRESSATGIYKQAKKLLEKVFLSYSRQIE